MYRMRPPFLTMKNRELFFVLMYDLSDAVHDRGCLENTRIKLHYSTSLVSTQSQCSCRRRGILSLATVIVLFFKGVGHLLAERA